MKSAALALSLIALVAARGVETTPADVNELSVTASGLKWKVNWTKSVMNGLKRLSGAKDVSQDDFQAGVATFIVTFDAQPKVKLADVKKEVGKYKVDQVKMKFTTMAPEGAKAGDLALANPKDEDLLKELAGLKGKKVVLSGVLTEDDKGAQTLTLSRVAEAK